MKNQMNAPKENLISKIGDKFKKVAVGAALLGTLTACDANWSSENQEYEKNFDPVVEQIDPSFSSWSEEVKYREDYDFRLKSEDEIDKVFEPNEYLNANEVLVKEKIDNREYVKKEYLRLKSWLGKEIYHLEIESYPTSYPIYCDSKKEYNKLLREFNIEKTHYVPTEMEAMQETATPMKPFTLTEDKLVEIIKEYATHPWIMPMEMREIWSELLERQE